MLGISSLKDWLVDRITGWLVVEREPAETSLSDFERLRLEIRPGDVILVEGRGRVSDVIRWITLSPWTHSALYIGRLQDIEDPHVKERIGTAYQGDSDDQLIVESLLGQGTVINSLEVYRRDHLRISRPQGLSSDDAQKVIAYAAGRLGQDYDVRQILDLARFLFPWSILPRRWRSSLFEHSAGTETRSVCSSMIAQSFMEVRFPILPVVQRTDSGKLRFYRRNFRLFTPRDFDFSPYFEIIKYPFMAVDEGAVYRRLPWDTEGFLCNAVNECFLREGGSDAPAGTLWPESGDAATETEAISETSELR